MQGWQPAPRAFDRLIRPHLLQVQKPARYIGEEPGAILKDWKAAALRFCLAFPDLYELGMSYYGREVLYQRVNARPDLLCERAFLPANDMQELMAQQGVALWALESKRPVRDFDLLGISLTYELAYPGALKLIDLAGIPLTSEARAENDPLVIAGGQCMCNPEPVAPFFDVIVNGEGEEVLYEIADTLIAMKGKPRRQRLQRLAQISGCYVPQFYAPGQDAARPTRVQPLQPGLPARIARRRVQEFASSPLVTNPLQSYLEIPSDKAYLEVMRGCPQGCRFCQAGYITRPARARPVAKIAQAAGELARNTGADEIGLLSLSTLDHPQVGELVTAVKAALPSAVGVAMPSLRADRMSTELAQLLRRPRETSITIAIETGSELLRRAINKRLTDEGIYHTFENLMQAGWHKFKLYFMCGFQDETLAEMDSIASLISRILSIARENDYRRPRLRISIAVLVPKPHTPLQWQAMERPEITRTKQQHLRQQLRRYGKVVQLSWHDAEQSVIEALLARGGRELAPVVAAACQAGQTMPSDNFDFAVWKRLLDECQVNLEHEVFRARARDEALPWDHIDRDVRKDYLWEEWQAYLRGESTPHCHEECTGCGVGCATPLFC